MPRWLLCDYGEVLCVPPPPDAWSALEATARETGFGAGEERDFHARYWAIRPPYDRADLTAAEYWTKTIGTAPDPATLDALIDADRAVWIHPNRAAIDAAGRAGTRGWRLALFSNAPIEVAAAIEAQPWLDQFQPRFFSCRLRAVKPEPEAYEAVLDGLNADPQDVVFFDDRPANVEEAARAGIDGRLFQDPGQFDELD